MQWHLDARADVRPVQVRHPLAAANALVTGNVEDPAPSLELVAAAGSLEMRCPRRHPIHHVEIFLDFLRD